MSLFANPESYQQKQSQRHLYHLPFNTAPFILKKAKEVYLYDLDEQKYIDFYFNQGTILQHSPPRLTKFIKNALSSGLNTGGLPSKFLLKTQNHWKKIFSSSNVSFFSSFLEMMVFFLHYLDKSPCRVAYTSDYLYHLLKPLEPSIILVKINNCSETEDCDLLLFEDYNHCWETVVWEESLKIPAIKVHSRFLYRREYQDWEDCFHYLDTFAGKKIGVLAGEENISYPPPAFDEGILLLEGAKLFHKPQKFLNFSHPKFRSYRGFAICDKELDSLFFLQRGIYLQGQVLYFSPLHTKQNLRRLYRALEEYFTLNLGDSLDQK
ncbi:MAG: hypothetical protein ACRC0X_03295 [Brevinema sp.]